jgi:hypothetical protein
VADALMTDNYDKDKNYLRSVVCGERLSERPSTSLKQRGMVPCLQFPFGKQAGLVSTDAILSLEGA